MHRLHRTETRRSYKSVIDVFFLRVGSGGSGSGCRCRWCSSSDQLLLLSGVYLYVFVILSLHLRSVIFLRTRACLRPRSIAIPMSRAAGIVIHDAKTNIFILRSSRSRLNRGILMSAATQSTSNSLTYYYRSRCGCAGCSNLKWKHLKWYLRMFCMYINIDY